MSASGNVHEIARRANPGASVVYVDSGPVAVRHGESLLTDGTLLSMIQADAHNPQDIPSNPRTLELLDLERPVGLLMPCVPHFVGGDEQAHELTARLRDRCRLRISALKT